MSKPASRKSAHPLAVIIAAVALFALWIVPMAVFADEAGGEPPKEAAGAAAPQDGADLAGGGSEESGKPGGTPAAGQPAGDAGSGSGQLDGGTGEGGQPDGGAGESGQPDGGTGEGSGQPGGGTGEGTDPANGGTGEAGGQPAGEANTGDSGSTGGSSEGAPGKNAGVPTQNAAAGSPGGTEGIAAPAGPESVPAGKDAAMFAAPRETKLGTAALPASDPIAATHTFVFHNGGSVFDTVILKGDEVLYEPANPSQANKRFDGWCADEACTQPFDGFGKAAPVLDNGTTHVWAKFTDVHYFTYYDEDGHVIEVEQVELGASYTFEAQWPQFELKSDTSRNSGWKDAQGRVYAKNDLGEETIAIERDLDLYPVPEEGFYAHFHGQGGSATVSQFVHAGGKVIKPADPTREGYDFDGWYDAAEGGNVFDFDVAPTPAAGASVEIYAHWAPKEVEYTIAYWLENIEDTNHYFKESVTKTGLVGAAPVFDPATDGKTYKDEIGNVIYFYDADKTGAANQGKTIAADGSTVIDVYYYRFYYLVSLKDLPDANGVMRNYGPIKIKVGQNTSPMIFAMSSDIEGKNFRQLVNGQTGGTTQYWHIGRHKEFTAWTTRIWYVNRKCGTTVEIYPVADETTYDHGFQVWTEKLPGGDPAEQSSYEKTSDRSARNHINGSFIASSATIGLGFELYGIPGKNGAVQKKTKDIILEKDNYPYTKNKLYFVRVRNNIEFFGDSKELLTDITGVPFGMPISEYADHVAGYVTGETNYTSANGATFTFRGWWDNPGFEGDPVSFAEGGITMPAHGLQLFAKWEEETHTVTFDPNGGELHDEAVQTLHYGQSAEEPAAPTRHGFRFVDWHLADDSTSSGLGAPYHFGSPVNGDITLRAHWVSLVAHRVIYDPGEGSGTVESDGHYLSGSAARVERADALTPPAGKHFVYWEGSDGKRYHPGDIVQVHESDVVLTAVYAPRNLTELVYDLNYAAHGIDSPCGYEVSAGPSGLPNNSVVDLRQPHDMEVPAGYEFAGWYLDGECTGEPVSRVLVFKRLPLFTTQAEGEDEHRNVVYAKWTKVDKPAPDPVPGDGPVPDDPTTDDPAPGDPKDELKDDPKDEGSPTADKPAKQAAAAPKAASPKTGDAVPAVALGALALAALGTSLLASRLAARARNRRGE